MKKTLLIGAILFSFFSIEARNINSINLESLDISIYNTKNSEVNDPIVKQRKLIKTKEIPTEVKAVTRAGEYKGWVIYEAYKVELASGKKVIYELYMQHGFKTTLVSLDSNGKFVRSK